MSKFMVGFVFFLFSIGPSAFALDPGAALTSFESSDHSSKKHQVSNKKSKRELIKPMDRLGSTLPYSFFL